MENHKDFVDFEQVYNKIQQFFIVFEELVESHKRLKTELEEAKANPRQEEYLKRINELEMEISNLKKTNKTLKETENLIKNKIERLAVKVERIEF
jgi:hypothetical protein